LSSPYEVPEKPELTIDTRTLSIQECVDILEEFLIRRSIISNKKNPLNKL